VKRWRRVIAAALVGGSALLASCAAPPAPPEVVAERAEFDPHSIKAVLVAGDDSTRTFDNAVRYLGDELSAAGVAASAIHRFSAAETRPDGAEKSAIGTVLGTIAGLHPAPGGGCLVYVTSHGEADGAVTIGADGSLQAAALDRALTAGCSDTPTIVVVSACRSGGFAGPAMARANRVILTASSADRDSFDCGAGSVFTFFDECLLAALPAAADWETVYERAQGCVEVRERHVGVLPSEPQASIGAAASHLPTPWRLEAGTNRDIDFTAGPERFSAAHVPFRRAERQPLAAQLKAYDRARPPKSLAILPDGLAVWLDADTGGTKNADDLARLVLERCELISGGGCVLYARDDRVVRLLPSGMAPFHPPVLVRTGRFRPDDLPFIPARRRDEAVDYAADPGPKALALSPSRGAIGIGHGATPGAARGAALALCGSDAPDCLIYAEGDEIVLGWGG
jgi:hypothetical protein